MKIDFDNFPSKCGVYIFKDKDGIPLYIGKAKEIKKRIQSHFKEVFDQRKEKLLNFTETIDFIITDDELSALFLENNLIKEYQPKFNVNLKDDKTYPFIAITIKGKFPKIFYTRKIIKDAIYFGPFYPAYNAKKIISFIQKSFGLCSCKRDLNKVWKKPCLYFYIKRCLGPCVPGLTNTFEYKKKTKQAILFLKGKDKKLLNEIKKEIEKKAKELKFEEANFLKEVYLSILNLKNTKDLNISKEKVKDIFGIYKEGNNICLLILNFKNGLLFGKKSYIFEDLDFINLKEFLSEAIQQYYLANPIIPSEIIVPFEIKEEIFLNFLRERKGKKVKIVVPKRGDNYKLLKIAQENSKEFYQHKFPMKGLENLKILLNLIKINSIAGVDISHFQGRKRYGGIVFFEDGKFEKKKYRIFKLHTEDPRDDPGGIYEILKRFLNRSLKEQKKLPDLILIDGGKTQLSAGNKALEELSLSVPLISLEKGEEKIFIKKNKKLSLEKDDPALLLLMKIRDEAHRFVISLHRRTLLKAIKRKKIVQI